jgi:hypothetical protein
MAYPLKKGVANQYVPVRLFDANDHVTPETGVTSPTITASKNGSSLASLNDGLWTEIGGGMYTIRVNATDTNTEGWFVCRVTATGCEEGFALCYIVSKTAQDIIDGFPTNFEDLTITDTSGEVTVNNVDDCKADVSGIPAAVDQELTTQHGDGSWQGAVETDLSGIPAAVDTYLTNQHGSGSWLQTTCLGGSVGPGSGAILFTYHVTEPPEQTGTPISDVLVWVTTDQAGTNIIASNRTDTSGDAKFNLDAGTYYFWRKKAGWDFDDPDVETVS